jgi:hypothetical protein
MLESKQSHPRWYLWLYPYLWMLRHNRKYFFRIITGRVNWAWHYEWERPIPKIEELDIDSYKSVNFRQSSFSQNDPF